MFEFKLWRSCKLSLLLALCLLSSACIGTVVGAVVDTTIEVVKVPFKVVGAAVDVVTGEDLTDTSKGSKSDKKPKKSPRDSALQGESEGIN